MTIEIIKQKLILLQQLDSKCHVFGASSHQYQCNPVVTEQEIIDFEKNFSCTLPPEYRLFLTQIGNGGVGMSYGVFPLGCMDDSFDLNPWDDWVKPDKPFRFTAAFNDQSMLERGAPQKEDFATQDEYYKAHDDWADDNMDELYEEYWEKHALDGAIPICHHGCASRSWLVVAQGAEYGYIWDDNSADTGGVAPASIGQKERINFFEWYSDWLDESVQQLRRS